MAVDYVPTDKYLVTGEYLVGIADGLRDLSGSTSKLTPPQMQTTTDELISNVTAQTTQLQTNANLINQIKTALSDKAYISTTPEWIECSTLPTAYADDPVGGDTVVYIEIPENCKAILLRSPAQSSSIIKTNTSSAYWHITSSGDVGTFSNIEIIESNILSVAIDTQLSLCQYMII